MSETITLLCWVIDTPTERIFPVEVGHVEIWGKVKEAIKEKKPEFDDIDADALDLWKTTIDRSQLQSLSESVKKVTAKKSLNPIDSLSTEFKDPPDGHINIIVVQ